MKFQRLSVCAVAALLLLCFGTLLVSADTTTTPDPLSSTPIPASECSSINPNPTVTTCADFTQPTTNLYASLPWTEPAYQTCVQQRCVCSQMKDSVDFTPSGYYCDATGFKEDGVFTCDALMQCFSTFWECVTDALGTRYYNNVTLTAAETAVMQAQLDHGRTPGNEFDTTQLYYSCSQIICEATATRGNCGLLTCLPNFTQCFEFIRPPVLPYKHQLCTQGCRAALTVMAVTIFTLFMGFLCCGVCPARVRVIEPLVTKGGDDDDDELGREKKSSSGSRHGRDADDAPSHASGNEPQEEEPAQQQSRAVPEEKMGGDDDDDDEEL